MMFASHSNQATIVSVQLLIFHAENNAYIFKRRGRPSSYFVDVKSMVLEDMDEFVQEMSESVTRELNTLTKSLANVQMQGGA